MHDDHDYDDAPLWTRFRADCGGWSGPHGPCGELDCRSCSLSGHTQTSGPADEPAEEPAEEPTASPADAAQAIADAVRAAIEDLWERRAERGGKAWQVVAGEVMECVDAALEAELSRVWGDS